MDLHRRRSLPWYRSKKDAILDKKKKFCREPREFYSQTIGFAAKGDNTMPSLAELVDHLKSLKTEEKPDYVYLKVRQVFFPHQTSSFTWKLNTRRRTSTGRRIPSIST